MENNLEFKVKSDDSGSSIYLAFVSVGDIDDVKVRVGISHDDLIQVYVPENEQERVELFNNILKQEALKISGESGMTINSEVLLWALYNRSKLERTRVFKSCSFQSSDIVDVANSVVNNDVNNVFLTLDNHALSMIKSDSEEKYFLFDGYSFEDGTSKNYFSNINENYNDSNETTKKFIDKIVRLGSKDYDKIQANYSCVLMSLAFAEACNKNVFGGYNKDIQILFSNGVGQMLVIKEMMLMLNKAGLYIDFENHDYEEIFDKFNNDDLFKDIIKQQTTSCDRGINIENLVNMTNFGKILDSFIYKEYKRKKQPGLCVIV